MLVTKTTDYDTYWKKPAYRDKIPVRNGSKMMMVGDNIYHAGVEPGSWIQEDSHHSRSDGSPNSVNLENDTKSTHVLISHHFYYFGKSAPVIPDSILERMSYRNGRNHRRFSLSNAQSLIDWLERECGSLRNQVVDDPFDFDNSHHRYSPEADRVIEWHRNNRDVQ